MRVLVAIVLLPILCLGGTAKPLGEVDPIVGHYLNSFSSLDASNNQNNINLKFFGRLENKRKFFSSDVEFLRFVFDKVHAKFLKNFDEKATFNDLASRGRYNCLTATALYALVLQNLKVHYAIFETNNHIFLSIETPSGKILLETTDPNNGFKTDPREIESTIAEYRSTQSMREGDGKLYYQFSNNLFNQVTLEGIVGLLNFNAAVRAYNNHDMFSAVDFLEKAANVYQSSRVDEFSSILFLTVVEGGYDARTKNLLLPRISIIKDHKLRALATLQ